jgi:hypothetical protein
MTLRLVWVEEVTPGLETRKTYNYYGDIYIRRGRREYREKLSNLEIIEVRNQLEAWLALRGSFLLELSTVENPEFGFMFCEGSPTARVDIEQKLRPRFRAHFEEISDGT